MVLMMKQIVNVNKLLFELSFISVIYICRVLLITIIFPPYHFFLSTQAHNDLLRTYEAKLQAFGVPTEELGFKPLESTVGGQQLGQGAAGLVAAPT